MELTKSDLKEMNIEIGPQKIILKLIDKLRKKQQNREQTDFIVCEDGHLKIIEKDDSGSDHGSGVLLTNRSYPTNSSTSNAFVESQNKDNNGASSIITTMGFSRYQTVHDTLLHNKQGAAILEAINKKQFGEDERQSLVRILVAELIVYHNDYYPPKGAKWALAKNIVSEFPNLKDNSTSYGCEHYFDIKTSKGFIENRLQNARRILTPSKKKYQTAQIKNIKAAKENHLSASKSLLNPEVLKEKISWMQLSMPDANKKQHIASVLMETFNDRRHWINTEYPTFNECYAKYPRLFDYFGTMIEQEFELMFDQETADNFMGRFTTFYVPRILKYCEKKQTDILKKTSFIEDDNLRALIILPELLPVTNFTKGKRSKKIVATSVKKRIFENSAESVPTTLTTVEKITDNENHILSNDLLKILPEGTHVSHEVENIRRKSKTSIQPYLVCVKGQSSNTFFIQGDGCLIDLERNVNSMAAFDRLFKLHYVLNVEYSKSLSFFYNFMECFVYRMKNSIPKSSVASLNISLSQFYEDVQDDTL